MSCGLRVGGFVSINVSTGGIFAVGMARILEARESLHTVWLSFFGMGVVFVVRPKEKGAT